jgi:hypothetical protein
MGRTAPKLGFVCLASLALLTDLPFAARAQRCPFLLSQQLQVNTMLRQQQLQAQLASSLQPLQLQAQAPWLPMQGQARLQNRPTQLLQAQAFLQPRTLTLGAPQLLLGQRTLPITTLHPLLTLRQPLLPTLGGSGLARAPIGLVKEPTGLVPAMQFRRTTSVDLQWPRWQRAWWQQQERPVFLQARPTTLPNISNRLLGQRPALPTGLPNSMTALRRQPPAFTLPVVNASGRINATCGNCHKNQAPGPMVHILSNPPPVRMPVINPPQPQPLVFLQPWAPQLPLVPPGLPPNMPGFERQLQPRGPVPAVLLPPAQPAPPALQAQGQPQQDREDQPDLLDPPVLGNSGPRTQVIDAIRQELAGRRTPLLVEEKKKAPSTMTSHVQPEDVFAAPLLPSGASLTGAILPTPETILEYLDEDESLADILFNAPPPLPRPRGLIGSL